MTHFILHTFALLFVAFLIGLVLGYWLKSIFSPQSLNVDVPSMPLRQTKSEDTEIKIEPKAIENDIVKIGEEIEAEVAVETYTDADKPAVLSSARDGKADNLKRISGIGPANEKKLNGLGIYHFDQIASWSANEVEWVNGFLAFPGRIQREDWINQAKLLASGQETEFAKRVDKGEVESSL